MHGGGKSDEAIVAVKPANEAEQSAAELVEPRAEAKGNAVRQSTYRTQCRGWRVTSAGSHTPPRPRCVVWTRGGSRMRESRTYGSVRGALSNERPYHPDRRFAPSGHRLRVRTVGSFDRVRTARNGAPLRTLPARS